MSNGLQQSGNHKAATATGEPMDPRLLLEVLGQAPIVFHRVYLDITGSVTAAVYLAYTIYYVCERNVSPDDWFHRSKDDWTRETGLSRHEQDSSRARLKLLEILEERRPDQNAPLQYRINFLRLYHLMQSHCDARMAHGTAG